jgi:hypothetical protein
VRKSDRERFNLEKLSDVEVKKQYQVKISNRFAALENLDDGDGGGGGDDDVDINRGWESITENIKAMSHRESRLLYLETAV